MGDRVSWESEVVAGATGEVLSGVVSAATAFCWESELVAGPLGEAVSGMVSAATVFSGESEVVPRWFGSLMAMRPER